MTHRYASIVLLVAALGCLPQAQPGVWRFEGDAVGKPAAGFPGETGQWTVVSPEPGQHALMQTARSPDATFNVALARGTSAQDLELTVRLRAVAGEDDQGGGLVWRARDSRNYYVCRFNPLEDNFRVYKVVDGKRTQFATADVKRSPGWHTIRARMDGDRITCVLDGKTSLEVRDSTFPGAGMVGLWTKADARTQFDDLELIDLTLSRN